MRDTYWAAEPTETFAGELEKRVDAFYDHVQTSGRLALWRKCHQAWHAGGLDGGRLGVGGENDQLTMMKVNHLRNIGTHTVNLITAQRPAFDPKAAQDDYESEDQCVLAASILDYDLRSKRLEEVLRQAVEYAVELGEGFLLKTWDTKAGEPWGIDPDTGKPILAGAMRYGAYQPLDVVRDPIADAPVGEQLRWFAIRRWVNRWDTATKYPGQADAVLGAPTKREIISKHWLVGYTQIPSQLDPDDEVELFEFYHARTEALPDGRRTLWCGGQCLADGPLPYRTMPGFRVAASNQKDTPFGYTIIYDLLPLQDAVNALFSTVATNQAAFGVQSILVPRGHAISVAQLTQGLQAITYDPGLGEPKPLNLVKTSPETFTFASLLVQTMETLSGISSVVRGDPQASLKSGSALAMVASQALQYTVNLQAAYVLAAEALATASVEDYQDFAEMPQVVQIAGQGARGKVREWVGSDIAKVTRVVVDMGNALSKTLAGRSEIATQLIQAGLIPDARTYIEVLTTGRLDQMTKDAMSELLLIRAENEKLAQGVPMQAIATDDHALHIRQHRQVTASPASRENEPLVQAVLDHQQQHIDLLRNTDPLLLSTLGIPVPPDSNGPPGAQGAPPPGQPLPPGPDAGGPGMPGLPNMPAMPGQPTNPQSGQKANAPPPPSNTIPLGVEPAPAGPSAL